MALNVVLGLVIGIIGLIYIWVKKRFTYWSDRGVVQVPPVFPFGTLTGVGYKVHFSKVTELIYNEYKKKASMVGMYFFTAPVILALDLELIKHILVKDFNNFHDRGIFANAKTDPLSAHLFAIEGAEWKNMRAKLTPTFTSGKMKMMFGTVVDISVKMIEHINEEVKKPEFEMKELLAQFTTDVIGNVAFGLEMNSMKDPNSMFRKMGRKVFETPPLRTMKVLFLSTFRKLAIKLGLKITQTDVSDFFLKSIRETVDYREANDVQRNDFMNLLLQIKNKGKINDDKGESIGTLSFNELAAQCFLFFLAGFETSSTTMTFALYELALNPDIQEKLRQEIKATLKKYDDKLTYEAMLDIKYLQMVIDETLRKYPPMDMLGRIASNDYKVPNTDAIIPKDTLVFIPAFAIQRDPEIYPNPDKFDPERFNDENKQKLHPMAHIPFGEGPRNCVGLRFGLMQTKIGLIQLLSNYKFSPSNQTTIPMVFIASAPLLAPVNDMWLKVEKVH
ncbi:unnamed protein product [Diamesa hyperborea]